MAERRLESTGQIIRLYADVATVQMGDGDVHVQATIRGKLFTEEPPAVGDWVSIEERSGGQVISGVLPRKSVLARRAAGSASRRQILIANVDQVMVVFAAASPEPNLATLDRFLVVVEANDLQGQIIINKVDLVERREVEELFEPYKKAGYVVHYTSVRTGEGLGELRRDLEGKESVFVGPSGVGKSSLLNSLYPGLDLKVGLVSAAYGKGRHTTVGGFLIKLPGDASVADTAGLREVGLWMVPPDELPHCFLEFRPYLGECRFSDCAHLAEPGCAVRAALERGDIYPSRYDSYVKLREEATATWPRW
ncbi:MAG: ribosome small subunit-dependent GTPase A [Chloroflexi bacterium]|nr:ribosome small subunit-dependent GTPase A [Chloroflexota bacterium]